MTLAAVTSRIVADLIHAQNDVAEISPFRPDRFN
jgi:hypothetical protein